MAVKSQKKRVKLITRFLDCVIGKISELPININKSHRKMRSNYSWANKCKIIKKLKNFNYAHFVPLF